MQGRINGWYIFNTNRKCILLMCLDFFQNADSFGHLCFVLILKHASLQGSLKPFFLTCPHLHGQLSLPSKDVYPLLVRWVSFHLSFPRSQGFLNCNKTKNYSKEIGSVLKCLYDQAFYAFIHFSTRSLLLHLCNVKFVGPNTRYLIITAKYLDHTSRKYVASNSNQCDSMDLVWASYCWEIFIPNIFQISKVKFMCTTTVLYISCHSGFRMVLREVYMIIG